MPIEMEANVFSVKTSVNKKGEFCANIILINMSSKGKFEAYLTEKTVIEKFIKNEGADVIIKGELVQSKFGDRVNLLDVVA